MKTLFYLKFVESACLLWLARLSCNLNFSIVSLKLRVPGPRTSLYMWLFRNVSIFSKSEKRDSVMCFLKVNLKKK